MSYLYKSNFPQGTPHFFPSPQSLEKIPESLISPFLVGWLSGVLPVLHTSMVEPKKKLEKKPWFLDMAKISIPFFALPEMNPKLRYEMIGPEFIL